MRNEEKNVEKLFKLIEEKRQEWASDSEEADEGEEESEMEVDPEVDLAPAPTPGCDDSGSHEPSSTYGMLQKREKLAELHEQIQRLRNFVCLDFEVC